MRREGLAFTLGQSNCQPAIVDSRYIYDCSGNVTQNIPPTGRWFADFVRVKVTLVTLIGRKSVTISCSLRTVQLGSAGRATLKRIEADAKRL